MMGAIGWREATEGPVRGVPAGACVRACVPVRKVKGEDADDGDAEALRAHVRVSALEPTSVFAGARVHERDGARAFATA